MKVTTNNKPREVIDGAELTDAERAEFDYLNWAAVDEGAESASFVRYRGQLHDLGEFTTELPDSLTGRWQGIRTDSFFSALLIRYTDRACEYVVVGCVTT